MPYRYAYLGVLLLLVAAGFAFWPSYFSRLPETGWVLHAHGVTATLWMVLLIVQNIAIGQGHRALHRRIGMAMLVVIPLFTAAGLMVVHTLNAADTQFSEIFGHRLGFIDTVAVIAFAGFCYAALANRRNVYLHGGYMLMTPLLLIMATVTRLNPFDYIQRLAPEASRVEQFDIAFNVSTIVLFVAIAVLWLSQRRYPAPFVAITVIGIVQWLAYYWIDAVPVWGRVADAMAAAPILLVGAVGLAMGIAAVWFGWRAPGQRHPRPGSDLGGAAPAV